MGFKDILLGRTPAEQRKAKEAKAAKRATERAIAQQAALAAAEQAEVQANKKAAKGMRRDVSTKSAVPVALLPAEAGSGVRVMLPSGKSADHEWQALTPTSLAPVYATLQREAVERYLDQMRAQGAGREIVAAGDEQGRLLERISPKKVFEEKDYYQLDSRYYTTLAIRSWPRPRRKTPEPSFWSELLDKVPEFTLSIHHWRLRQSLAERTLRDVIRRQKTQENEALEKSHGVVTSEVAQKQDERRNLEADRDAVVHGNKAVFHLSCYIRPQGADSEEGLRENVRQVYSALRPLKGDNLALLQLPGEQRDAFVSSMPFASDPAYVTNFAGADHAAQIFPLITKTHIQRDAADEIDGVLYGLHAVNWTPVILSPWRQDGAPSITGVLGKPGAGKSYWARCHVGRLSMTGVQVFVVDPLNGYGGWFAQNKGQIIEIAPGSPFHINPFRRVIDIDNNGELESIDNKVARLQPLFQLLLGNSWDDQTKDLLNGALTQFYVNWDPNAEPLMRDFVTFLKGYDQLAATGEQLSGNLRQKRDRIYDQIVVKTLDGNMRDLFAHPTNVDVTSNRVYFNLKPSEKGEMLTLAAYLAVTLAVDQAKRSRDKKLLILDELHEVLNAASAAPAIGQLIKDLMRTHRHWNTAITLMTQFFDTETMDPVLASIMKSITTWVLFQATAQMLDQTIDMLGESADANWIRGFLADQGSGTGAHRAASRPAMIVRPGEQIPIYSVGLRYEDAEDQHDAAVRRSSERA